MLQFSKPSRPVPAIFSLLVAAVLSACDGAYGVETPSDNSGSVAAAEATSVASANDLTFAISATGAGTMAKSEAQKGTTVAPAPHAAPSPSASRPIIGANIHLGGGNATDNQAIADVMSSRHLMTARMDFNRDVDLVNFRDQIVRLKAKGIKAEIDLQTSYQWDHTCSQSLAAVEQDAYGQTVTLVQRIGDIVQDFELLNEVSLRPDTAAQVTPNQGTPASGYVGKTCYNTLAAVLRGMSKAIVAQRTSSRMPLRIILGAVSNDFGFLEFMQQQGVFFDIVGYHTYPSLTQSLLSEDTWYGAGGALGQLAKFNKPVRINEFNCGEIYSTQYENKVRTATTDACLAGIQKHLKSLIGQTVINLESIHAYEITDRPAQATPENRFGLMYDLDNPKLHLALYSAFAGGFVSSAEKQQLDALGLAGP